jgi:hypothetical protein
MATAWTASTTAIVTPARIAYWACAMNVSWTITARTARSVAAPGAALAKIAAPMAVRPA